MADVVPVYLEIGPKRTFAGAIEWPGWCRSGKTEADALQALVAYGPRYAAVVGRSTPAFTAPGDVANLRVVERLEGGSGTDFGVPSAIPAADDRPVDNDELARFQRLLRRCWSAFDAAADSAVGIELRKGPRGGGRDLRKMEGHVREADEAYLLQLGARPPKLKGPDPAAELRRLRLAVLAALAARSHDEEPADPSRVKTRWRPRYCVRRTAWHVLDHAWEIEDRMTPQPKSGTDRAG